MKFIAHAIGVAALKLLRIAELQSQNPFIFYRLFSREEIELGPFYSLIVS